jgi:D-alanyl-D-alanine carboxypeptidase
MPHRNKTTIRPATSALVAVAALVVTAAGSPIPLTASFEATGPGAATSTTADTSPPCVEHVRSVTHAQAPPEMFERALSKHLRHRLDDAARDGLEQASTPGAIVGVRTPDGTWTKSYGFAAPATLRRMKLGTHTRIGSVTKTFTGTLVLQLAQEGRLSLDDPISEYVAGVPSGDKVTLRHLTNMTSGVASYTANTAFTDRLFANPRASFDVDELIAIGLADSPIFAPGAQFYYSNTNFLLLGKVIEKVTGERLGTVYHKRIFAPLSLKDTSWPGKRRTLPKPYAQGFTLQGNTATPSRPSKATHWSPSWAGAAGAIISTMPDLLTYGRALATGQGLLRPRAQAERLRSFPRPATD